jgi:hypothetical protein
LLAECWQSGDAIYVLAHTIGKSNLSGAERAAFGRLVTFLKRVALTFESAKMGETTNSLQSSHEWPNSKRRFQQRAAPYLNLYDARGIAFQASGFMRALYMVAVAWTVNVFLARFRQAASVTLPSILSRQCSLAFNPTNNACGGGIVLSAKSISEPII